MALVNCPECRKKISSETKSCPNCGAPVDLNKIAKIQEDQKKTATGCGIAIIAFIILVVLYNQYDNSTTDVNAVAAPPSIEIPKMSKEDSIIQKRQSDSLAKVEAIEEAAYEKTKAGRIHRKHPDWSKEDCERIANNRIWIGMSYDMLLYERGKPDHVNTSDYGNGPEYQCCWDDYNTSCFYMKSDDIIYSYN